MKYYVSFGSTHLTQNGESLGKHYAEIPCDGDYDTAREVINEARGAKWCFIYNEDNIDDLTRHGITEIDFDHVRLFEKK